MRFKKTILSFILAFAFICSSFVNVSALNEIQVSDLFKEYFTEVFLKPEAVTVISKNNQDITIDFFDNNTDLFQRK